MSDTQSLMPRPAPRWRAVDGIVLLDKPIGLTSNAALQRVRRLFQARKAGHTGSLDPLASGLLPLCFGQATKVSGLLLDADKTYRVVAVLGSRTDTADAEGEVIKRQAVPALDATIVERALSGFLGEGSQVPPMYSALKHQGRRMYELARQGLEVERPARAITVHAIRLLGLAAERIEFEVCCSKGTYVRSLVEDLARVLGTVGHVAVLRRVALGPFTGQAMHTLEALEELAGTPGALEAVLLPVDLALMGWPGVTLDAAQQAAMLQGQAVAVLGPPEARVRIYGPAGRFLGAGRMADDGCRLAPERLMVDLGGPEQGA